MKQNKLVIVVLVIIAVLFILGLSSGLFRKKEPNDGKLTVSKAESYKARWVASLDKVMSPFRNSLDNRRLAQRAKCQTGDRSYKLVDESECTIEIAASGDGEDLEDATLTVEDNAATLKVAYPGIGACPTARGMGLSLKKITTPKVAAGIGKLKQPKVQKDLSPPQLELIVAYLPKVTGEEDEDYCKAVEKIQLSVLEKGGKIKMRCVGCDRQKKKAIRVKLK